MQTAKNSILAGIRVYHILTAVYTAFLDTLICNTELAGTLSMCKERGVLGSFRVSDFRVYLFSSVLDKICVGGITD